MIWKNSLNEGEFSALDDREMSFLIIAVKFYLKPFTIQSKIYFLQNVELKLPHILLTIKEGN